MEKRTLTRERIPCEKVAGRAILSKKYRLIQKYPPTSPKRVGTPLYKGDANGEVLEKDLPIGNALYIGIPEDFGEVWRCFREKEKRKKKKGEK